MDPCSSCHGPYHPDTGHVFTAAVRICGPCARHMTTWMKGMMRRRWGRQDFYAAAATSIRPPADGEGEVLMFPRETVLSGAPSHAEDPNVSEFRVMRSRAGFYVGTSINDGGYEVPNTRETGYFETERQAQEALDCYRSTGVMPRARTP